MGGVTEFGPNYPYTAALDIWNNVTITTSFDMSGLYDLRFSIDYEIHGAYDINDRTDIFYNCDGNNTLGMTMNRGNQLATQHPFFSNQI